MIDVGTEDGRQLKRRVLVEDANSDLLLIEGVPGMKGIGMAKGISRGQEVDTYTHGAGFATFHTQGHLIDVTHISIPLFEVFSEESKMRCDSKPKYKYIEQYRACVVDVDEIVTDAFLVPGSSGGAIVDKSGDLVGICSAGDGRFSYLVRHKDIKAFLANY